MSEAAVAGEAHPYLECVRPLIGRVLSLIDLETGSPSYGSFDRTWWCWKFTDFSAPRFQEGAYTLSLLATPPFSGHFHLRRDRLLRGAVAAMEFWTRLQHKDGSFDEAYPFERSLAATAFTLFYVGSAFERIRTEIPEFARREVGDAMFRAANWLARSDETHGVLSNHLAVAAAACQLAADALDAPQFFGARDRFLDLIYRNQDPEEGWMREYDGADPGYQSHGLFYLAEIHRRTKLDTLSGALARAIEFQAWFAHPDGTMGGEYASRGTKFFFPAAFEILSDLPGAAALAAHARRCASGCIGVGPLAMDAWNLFPMVNNYLAAAEAARPIAHADLPWRKPGARATFRRAGLAIANSGGRILAAGPGNGGAVKLWEADTGALIYEDCGYLIARRAGCAVSQGASEFDIEIGEDRVAFRSRAPFRARSGLRFDPWKFGAFRLFMLTLGRLPLLARAIKQLLVFVLIRKSKIDRASLDRSLVFDKSGALTIEDRISNSSSAPIPVARQVAIHMGSARYSGTEDFSDPQAPAGPTLADGPGFVRRFVAPPNRR